MTVILRVMTQEDLVSGEFAEAGQKLCVYLPGDLLGGYASEQDVLDLRSTVIQQRNINTGEMVEFEVSGDKIEAIYMIPGWTHNIINLSDTEDLVTVMTCNEVFDPNHPDTFFEKV